MARYPMKREAGQGIEAMAQQLAENSAGNRLNRASAYPEVSAQVKRDALAQVVNQQREMLQLSQDRGSRINLDSLEEVQACADAYMQACVRSNTFPTMLGFSAATGWSRPWVYRYIQTHNSDSARFLDNLRSSWAAIMAEMALKRQASEATAIFLLKNSGQNLTDSHEVTAIQQQGASFDEFGEHRLTAEEIARKYMTDFIDDRKGTTAPDNCAYDNT